MCQRRPDQCNRLRPRDALEHSGSAHPGVDDDANGTDLEQSDDRRDELSAGVNQEQNTVASRDSSGGESSSVAITRSIELEEGGLLDGAVGGSPEQGRARRVSLGHLQQETSHVVARSQPVFLR